MTKLSRGSHGPRVPCPLMAMAANSPTPVRGSGTKINRRLPGLGRCGTPTLYSFALVANYCAR